MANSVWIAPASNQPPGMNTEDTMMRMSTRLLSYLATCAVLALAMPAMSAAQSGAPTKIRTFAGPNTAISKEAARTLECDGGHVASALRRLKDA